MSGVADITIVGLGPGRAELLTLEAREALRAGRVFLRTRRHPTVAELPEASASPSFDELYERAETFEEVYQGIVDSLLFEAARGPLVYAVPGHPLVGEASARLVLQRAPERGLRVRIVPGLSFVDVTLPLLGIDALGENLQIVDALELVACVERQPFSGGGWPLSPLRPALIGQVYSRLIAGDVKLALFRLYPEDWPVTLVQAAGTAEAATWEIPLYELDHREVDHLTAVYLPAVPVEDAQSVEALQRIVARLRAPGGCPWDREQTHRTLLRHLIEEAYEVADAIESGDPEALRDELGDYLLQALMHAQIAEEAGDFTLEEVARHEIAKLVRRHPHVFGNVTAETAGAVLANWERIKDAERHERGQADEHPLGRIPAAMPALARAQALIRRARRRGLEVIPAGELSAWRSAFGDRSMAEDRLPLALAALCALAQDAGLDAEQSLRRWTLDTEARLRRNEPTAIDG